ncbi:hypothetical protein CR513_53091, partial [Mucuna pruriens]
MDFPHCFFTLFLLLVSFYCLSTSSLARSQTVVDIRNDLPDKSEHYNHTVIVDQDSECFASWGSLFTTWEAYQVNRDKGHQIIYWSVRKDGFYESWDGSKWNFIERWYSE